VIKQINADSSEFLKLWVDLVIELDGYCLVVSLAPLSSCGPVSHHFAHVVYGIGHGLIFEWHAVEFSKVFLYLMLA